jgi:hypothetical protein
MDFKTALIPFSEVPLTKQVLLELLKEYKRPFDKINELGKQGILVMIKNGLYVPGPASLVRGPEIIFGDQVMFLLNLQCLIGV